MTELKKEQIALLEKRKKEKKDDLMWGTILGVIGFLLMIYANSVVGLLVFVFFIWRVHSTRKDLEEIEFRLAGVKGIQHKSKEEKRPIIR